MSSKKKNLILFVILLILTNLIFLPWLSGHMATDSYNIFNLGYPEWTRTNSLKDARFLVVAYTYMMDYFQIPIHNAVIIMLELSIIISCLAIMILLRAIEQYKKPSNLWSEILLLIACYYTVYHFMYIENIYYMECGVMALSLVFYILAAKWITEKRKLWYIKSFLFLLLALMSYQGTISMFFITLLVLSMCKKNSPKEIVKDMLEGIGISLLAIFANQLEIKIVEQIYQVQQTRGINFSVIGNNIAFIISNFMRVLKNVGYYLPEYCYLAILTITELLMMVKLIKQNKEKQNRKNGDIIIEQIAIIVIGIGAGFIVSIMNASGFWSGRIRFSVGALIGFLWIHLWVKTDFAESKKKFDILLIAILILYGLMNTINYITIMINNNQVNQFDKETVFAMKQEVENYEIENDIKVTKVAIIIDESGTDKAFYSELGNKGSMVMCSAIRTQWSAAGCYNYYTGDKLETYQPTTQEEKNFLEQQVPYLCMEDTLYIAVYMY